METITQSLTLGLISSSFSLFLGYCFSKGEIFEAWANFLLALPTYIAKPLGACLYCQSTWVALFLCVFYTNTPIVYMGAIGLNYVLLDVYFKFIASE